MILTKFNRPLVDKLPDDIEVVANSRVKYIQLKLDGGKTEGLFIVSPEGQDFSFIIEGYCWTPLLNKLSSSAEQLTRYVNNSRWAGLAPALSSHSALKGRDILDELNKLTSEFIEERRKLSEELERKQAEEKKKEEKKKLEDINQLDIFDFL